MKHAWIYLLLAGCLADARAEMVPVRAASNLERTGSSPQKFGGIFEAEGAAFSIVDATDDDIGWPNGTQIVVSCSDQQFACWSQADADDITLTLATMNMADANGNDGRGACARIEAGSYRTFVLDLIVFEDPQMVGRRVSSCTGAYAGLPCFDNDDCPGASNCTVAGGITRARLLASDDTCAGSVE